MTAPQFAELGIKLVGVYFALEIAGVLILTAFLYWAAYVWATLPFGFGSEVFAGIGFLLPLASLAAVVGTVLTLFGLVSKARRAQSARLLGLSIAVVGGTAVGMWLGPIHSARRGDRRDQPRYRKCPRLARHVPCRGRASYPRGNRVVIGHALTATPDDGTLIS